MGKGKIAAQASHASLEAYLKTEKESKDLVKAWRHEGAKKVVLKIENEKELLKLYNEMREFFPCVLIRDAGHTQLTPGTITCFGCGPVLEEKVEDFIKNLKLL